MKEISLRKIRKSDAKRPVTLKIVAEYVGLAAGTVSAVLNDAPGSRGIPQRTKDRVLQAAAGPGTLMFVSAEHYVRTIQAIRSAGLSVPGDVSIVSVQNASSELDRLPS